MKVVLYHPFVRKEISHVCSCTGSLFMGVTEPEFTSGFLGQHFLQIVTGNHCGITKTSWCWERNTNGINNPEVQAFSHLADHFSRSTILSLDPVAFMGSNWPPVNRTSHSPSWIYPWALSPPGLFSRLVDPDLEKAHPTCGTSEPSGTAGAQEHTDLAALCSPCPVWLLYLMSTKNVL